MNRIVLFLYCLTVVLMTTPAFAVNMELVSKELDHYSRYGAVTVQETEAPEYRPDPEEELVLPPSVPVAPRVRSVRALSEVSVPLKKRHTFEMGLETYHYKYAEVIGKDKFMGTKGTYYGFFGAYTFRPADIDSVFKEVAANLYRFEGRYASGEVDYTGSGTFKGLEDYIFEWRVLAGKECVWAGGWQVMPYAGIGFRYLDNGLEEYSPGGYNRESKYVYAPIGFTAYKDLRGAWGVGFTAEYDVLLYGRQVSHLQDVDSGYEPLVNSQNKGYGLRGSFRIDKALPYAKVFFEPYYRYWHIQASEIAPIIYGGSMTGYAGLEPENTTQEVGIKMGVEF